MAIITNTRIFAAQLPAAELLTECLAGLPFQPVLENLTRSVGFIPDPITGELVTPLAGGFSICARHDEKMLPAGPVKVKLANALAAKEEELGRELSEEEAAQTEDVAYADMVRTALVRTTITRAFYITADELLLVATSSNPAAQVLMRALCKAMGSIKTSTIHIDNIRQGLTTRLGNHLTLEAESAFDGFQLGEYCRLAEKGCSAVFDMSDLSLSGRGMLEAIGAGMAVDRLGLKHELVSFRLTKDFALVKISYPEESEESLEAFDKECGESKHVDAAFYWRHEAAVELTQLGALVRALCALFDYVRPIDLPVMAAPSEGLTEELAEDEEDPLYEAGVAFVRESGRASVSAVQRKLLIGYNRARRMIERMEREGVITAADSHGAREVIAEG